MCTMNPDDLTSGQRLMAESRHMGVEVKVAADKLDRLEADNLKLRELVRDMYAVMVEDASNCDVTYPEQFDDRMRELGIEVDDDD